MWYNVDPLAEKTLQPYAYANNNPIRFADPTGMEGEDWVKRGPFGNWEYHSNITSEEQAKAAGFTEYANGRGDDNSTYTTSLSQNGVDTGVEKQVTLGEGGNWTASVNGTVVDQGTAKDQYVNMKPVDGFQKFMVGYIMFPAYIMSGGSGAGGTVIGNYLRGAATRGVTDVALQQGIKGSVDWKQTAINTFVGGGTGSTAVKLGWANLAANTANNFGTSAYEGTFKQDVGINSAKILTGAFGMGLGHLYSNYFGNTLLPGAYGTVTDKVLESNKPKK